MAMNRNKLVSILLVLMMIVLVCTGCSKPAATPECTFGFFWSVYIAPETIVIEADFNKFLVQILQYGSYLLYFFVEFCFMVLK